MNQLEAKWVRLNGLFPVCLAGFTLLTILGDTQHLRWLHYGCKPLIMGTLIGYSQLYARLRPTALFLLGMGLALLGDVLLMIQERDLFAWGLCAFLGMQVCYGITFWQLACRAGLRWLQALPFILYVSVFLLMLHPSIASRQAVRDLWWPVVVYALALGTMGFLATQRPDGRRGGWVALGALLFILSDSAIAIDRFVVPIPGAAWLIMGAYAPAQYLIVLGTLSRP